MESRFLFQLTNVLSRLMEARDPYTSGHQQRVADLARAIAQQLGLDRERIECVRVAGTVHDIGKVALPIEILSKPGALLPQEFALLTRHCEIAAEVLAGVDFPWPVVDVILQHHERFDGSGYPKGLAGENILLEARIIGAADAYDAMTSHRAYRPAIPAEQVLEYLEANRGRAFDGDVVEALGHVLAKRQPMSLLRATA